MKTEIKRTRKSKKVVWKSKYGHEWNRKQEREREKETTKKKDEWEWKDVTTKIRKSDAANGGAIFDPHKWFSGFFVSLFFIHACVFVSNLET